MLARVDVKGIDEIKSELPRFARGMARCGDILSIGPTRLRPDHKFGD